MKKIKQQIKEIFNSSFYGHPSREEDVKLKKAILFLADEIDKLYFLRGMDKIIKRNDLDEIKDNEQKE